MYRCYSVYFIAIVHSRGNCYRLNISKIIFLTFSGVCFTCMCGFFRLFFCARVCVCVFFSSLVCVPLPAHPSTGVAWDLYRANSYFFLYIYYLAILGRHLPASRKRAHAIFRLFIVFLCRNYHPRTSTCTLFSSRCNYFSFAAYRGWNFVIWERNIFGFHLHFSRDKRYNSFLFFPELRFNFVSFAPQWRICGELLVRTMIFES